MKTFINAAVFCSLVLDTISPVGADTTPCSISDGDLRAGIRVFDDLTCVQGGLGCFDGHCRFCKLFETDKSSAYDSCSALGFGSPTVTTPDCAVSAGNAAVGVSAVTDVSCLHGGVGCYNDHCRFCQLNQTEQSSNFMPCLDFNSSGSASPSSESCPLVAADGDVQVGINITTDTSCSSGGVGCINDVCRFCRLPTSILPDTYPDCPVGEANDYNHEVSVTLSDRYAKPNDVNTPIKFVMLGCVGAAAAVIMTVLALRRRLHQVTINAIRANPVVVVDDNDNDDTAKDAEKAEDDWEPSTPATCTDTEAAV